MQNPNIYNDQSDQTNFVQVKLLDVLFAEEVCNLVYMQDITSLFRNRERQRTQENLLIANSFTQNELKNPQKMILFLTDRLIESCDEKHREALEAIQHATNLMHLHVSNFTDFQLIKYDAFAAEDKVLSPSESIKSVIKMFT